MTTPLPVLAAPAAVQAGDLVRLFHRSQLQWSRGVAEEELTDAGTWLHNADLHPLAEANCVLDAALHPGDDPARVVAQVESMAAGSPVRGWTMNPSIPADRTDPLADRLVRAGWAASSLDVLHLARTRASPTRAVPGLTVIPARAGYGPLRRLLADRFGTAEDVRTEAALLHLDDPRLDAWLALRADGPVAAVGLLNDGEVGTVRDLYVAPPARGHGVGRLMLGHALEAAARSGHRHVLAGVEPGTTRLFAAAGFQPVGRWVRYVPPPTPES